jgi:regulator of protease activity HflC (stomatin/prohibitin superfamily)
MSTLLIIALVVVVIALLLLAMSIRIVREYQRVVVFRLGRCSARVAPAWC